MIFLYIIVALAGGSIIALAIYMFSGFGVIAYFRESRDKERILKEGRSARAKIISLGESSEGIVTVNDQPLATLTLEVYDGNKPPYQAKLETIISRLDVPRFQPGAMLSIKIDSQDPQKIALDPSGTGLQGYANTPIFKAEGISNQDEELFKNGIDGQARIISIKDTGESKNFNPVVRMIYEVQASGKAPYTLTKKVSMTTEAVNYVKNFIGKNVPVKVHPNDNNKVELTFNP